MATRKQIEANRRNALRSTGPSERGKLSSRRNALKHGLSGAGVVLPEALEAASRENAEALDDALLPGDGFEEMLVGVLAVEAARLGLASRQEEELLAERSRRAREDWGPMRELEVESLAEGLAKRPAKVALELKASAHGCAWLLRDWKHLAYVLEADGGLDREHYGRALDLLGIPQGRRRGPLPLDPVEGPDPLAGARAFIAAQIAELEARRASLADREARQKEAAIAGTDAAESPDLKRVRRYLRASQNAMKWALRQLQAHRGVDSLPPHVLRELTDLEAEVPFREDVAPDDPDEVAAPQPAPRPRPVACETKPISAGPAVAPALCQAVEPARPMNRQQRRAAEKLARRR